jgi:hypothetical protein
MQYKVSVFQRFCVPRNITSHWGIDMQRQEASCNKTCACSRVTIHNDVLQVQRAIEQGASCAQIEYTAVDIDTHTCACVRVKI